MISEYTEATDRARCSVLAREMLSKQLLEALKAALAGAPHWRFEAQQLLRQIDAGEPPEHLG
jgi:hypothetical protein